MTQESHSREYKLSYEHREALRMIRASEYLNDISMLTVQYSVFNNSIAVNNIDEAAKIIEKMRQIILES